MLSVQNEGNTRDEWLNPPMTPPLAFLAPQQPHLARDGDVMLFEALRAVFQDHQYCGELDGGVEGDCVWMTCTAER